LLKWHQLDATVLGAALTRFVGRHEVGLAEALRNQLVGGDTFIFEVTRDRRRAALR
jgi:hypothetical protein